jgi:hypothetical protein
MDIWCYNKKRTESKIISFCKAKLIIYFNTNYINLTTNLYVHIKTRSDCLVTSAFGYKFVFNMYTIISRSTVHPGDTNVSTKTHTCIKYTAKMCSAKHKSVYKIYTDMSLWTSYKILSTESTNQ